MQYVTEEVAREIERAVEVIQTNEQGFLRDAALEYIKKNAPTDKVEGEKYIAIKPHADAVDTGSILTLRRDDGTERPHYEAQDGNLWWVYQENVRRISALTAPETDPAASLKQTIADLRTENARLEADNARMVEMLRHFENIRDEQRDQLADLMDRVFRAKKALEGGK